MTMKARTCNGVGTVLWHLKKPLVGLAWHQKDLKYSAVAGDVEGMQRALRNLELLSAATKNSTSAGVTLVLLQVWGGGAGGREGGGGGGREGGREIGDGVTLMPLIVQSVSP